MTKPKSVVKFYQINWDWGHCRKICKLFSEFDLQRGHMVGPHHFHFWRFSQVRFLSWKTSQAKIMIFKGHPNFQNTGGKILSHVSDSHNKIWRYICFSYTADAPPRPFQTRQSLSDERYNPCDCNEIVIAFHWDSRALGNCISVAVF